MPPSWISGRAAFGRPCVLAAPLAEITDSAFRQMSFSCGADGAVTEMVCAAGLVRGSRPSAALLSRLPTERGWCAAQLYGHDPDELAAAARAVAASGAFDAVDLNAGCPMRRIVANGDGAALMRDETLFARCVEAMARAVSPLPLTVKTRIGLDPSRPAAARLARLAERAGAAAIIVHGRFASRFHEGPPDWALVREAVEAVSIPVVANGGVNSADDALAAIAATGAAGVMVGRGAVGNPWLFGEIRAAFEGAPAPRGRDDLSGEELLEALRRHLALALEAKTLSFRIAGGENPAEGGDAARAACRDPESAVALDARRHLLNYFRGRPGASAMRRAAQSARTPGELLDAAREAVAAFPGC